MTKIHVQLPYGLDARKTAQDYEAGRAPDRVAYGFDHAQDHYETVTYSGDFPESRLEGLLRRALIRLLNFDLVHAWRNRRAIVAADAVWTMLESEYLAILALYLLNPWLPRRPVIAQNIWLFNTIDQRHPLLRRFYLALAAHADVLLTHSEACLPIMREYLPDSRVELMHFGVSSSTFPLRKRSDTDAAGERPIRIFAAGNDRTRDWTTLLKAFGNDDRFELVVVCSWLSDATLAEYRNLSRPRNPTQDQFHKLYDWGDFVVVPMYENRFSGITVALEGVAMGVPVVSSRTGGVPTYFSEGEVLYAPVGDAGSLRQVVLDCGEVERRALVERAQQKFATNGYHTREMIARYKRLTDALTSSEAGTL